MRSLRRVGRVKATSKQKATLPLEKDRNRGRLGVAAFVQDPGHARDPWGERLAARRTVRVPQALALGAVTVATLEAVETSAFWWWYRQVTPRDLPVHRRGPGLGPEAFETGAWAVWLGVALHLFIAFVVVAVYVFASRSLPALTCHPVPWGLAYGAGVHLVMHFIVIRSRCVPNRRV